MSGTLGVPSNRGGGAYNIYDLSSYFTLRHGFSLVARTDRLLHVMIVASVSGVSPPTHNQGPYDTSLAVIRHKKPLKVRLSRRLNASARRGSPNPSSCTPPTNLGLVGARTARHDREPGGLQVRVGVGLAEEKGHQEAALLAELD